MDEEAKARFEEMYLTYQDTLRRLAYAYDIPVDDIDDIIQDTFVSYARYDYSLDQPEMGKKLLLGKILKNRCNHPSLLFQRKTVLILLSSGRADLREFPSRTG